jgi:hypothetical protein
VRLTALAAAVLAAAAACTSAPAVPTIAPAPSPPREAQAMAVTAVDAQRRLLDHGFACEPLAVATGGGRRCVADQRDEGNGRHLAVVDLLADDGGLVTLIQASVDVADAKRPDLAGFLGFYASTVFGIVEDPAPRPVDAWLRQHVATPGSVVLHGLVLEMAVERTRSVLRIWQRRPAQALSPPRSRASVV